MSGPYINFNVYRLKPNEEGGLIAEGIGGACYEEHANALAKIVAADSGAGCTVLVIAETQIRSVRRGTGRSGDVIA